MILNDRQYRITKAHADKFRAALEQQRAGPDGAGAAAKKRRMVTAGLEAQLAELDRQLAAYDRLKTARGRKTFSESIAEFGLLLIQARVSRGWTQRELADRLGVKMQQIQRYEASGYEQASLARLQDVARVLGLDVSVRGKMIDLPDLEAIPVRAGEV